MKFSLIILLLVFIGCSSPKPIIVSPHTFGDGTTFSNNTTFNNSRLPLKGSCTSNYCDGVQIKPLNVR
jgi:hypothetical protein